MSDFAYKKIVNNFNFKLKSKTVENKGNRFFYEVEYNGENKILSVGPELHAKLQLIDINQTLTLTREKKTLTFCLCWDTTYLQNLEKCLYCHKTTI